MNAESIGRNLDQPSLRHFALSMLVLACTSFGAMLLNTDAWGAGSITIFWPSTGLLMGMLLCLPKRAWTRYILGAFAIDLLVNLIVTPPEPAPVAFFLACCNVIEVLIGASLLYAVLAPKRALSRAGELVRFLFYGAIVAPAIASLATGFYVTGHLAWPTFHSVFNWFTADGLGDCIIIPLYLSLRRQAPFSQRRWYEVAFLFALLIAVSTFVFWQTTLPLLYVILPFLLLVEVRLGLGGSAIGLLAVSVIGGFLTARHHGPVVLSHLTSLSSNILSLQCFTFVCMIVLYIVEVVLAERNRFEVRLKSTAQLFRIVAEGSSDMILLRDLDFTPRFISPAVTTLLGWTPDEFLAQSPESLVHPEDLPALRKVYAECKDGLLMRTLDLRCKKKDGSYLWMQTRLALHAASNERTTFISVVRDISREKLSQEELRRALGDAQSRANIDSLTRAASRGAFDDYARSEWQRAVRTETPISLIMLDVDFFKDYNDLYGHPAGDACLRAVADAVSSCTRRAGDLFARYGGEEFGLILPATDSMGARSLAEQIQSALILKQIEHGASPLGFVTVSMGYASHTPGPGSSLAELIQSADSALYRAKALGRNCIVEFEEFVARG